MNALLSRIRRAAIDPHTGDGPLLEAFLAGDQAAFAALVRRYAGLVFGACRRVLRHTQDAEDAFQATFLVLARRASDVWPREAVGAWLFGVAHRVALKARAARAKRDSRETQLGEAPAPDASDPTFDLAEAVQRVVAKLPEVYRAAVVACDLEGLSRKCAAERLGWSEGTLSGRLARARQLLAKRLAHLGASVPALAALLVPVPAARAAAIQNAIDLSAGTAVSAPVLALSEGVVHGMFATKLKLAVAAVLATCALGFGTLTAGGSGDGTQPGAKATPTGGAPTKPLAPLAAKEKSAATDAELLQGRWRGVSRVHDDKPTPVHTTTQAEVEFRGTTMVFPAFEGEKFPRKIEFQFELGASDGLRTIDLTSPGKPTVRGIYEFTLPSTACAKCHSGTPDKGVNAAPACAPALLALVPKGIYGLRVALTTDGPRPKTFGGKGVVVTELVRVAAEEAALDELLREREKRAQLEAERERAVDEARKRDQLRALAEQLEWLAQQKETAVEAKKLRVEMEALSAKLDNAAERVRVSQRKVIAAREELAQAESTLAQSFADYRVLQAQLEALQKKAEGAKSTPNAVAAVANFTVHVRTLTAAEKVYKVKATGNQTILEAIVYAADDVSVKSDAVSVWVVRGKEVLTVDLPAILKNGETKTNYVLKAGDRVFVQAKPAK